MDLAGTVAKYSEFGFSELVENQWNELDSPIHNFFSAELSTSRLSSVLNTLRSLEGKLCWISLVNDRFVGLLCRSNTVFITLAENIHLHQVHAPNNGLITHLSMFKVAQSHYILIGDDRGGVSVYSCELEANYFTTILVASYSGSKSAIKSIVHQPIDMLHRCNQNILYLWLVCENGVRFVGCKLPQTLSSATAASSPSKKTAAKKIQLYFQLDVAGPDVLGVFQRAQVCSGYTLNCCL